MLNNSRSQYNQPALFKPYCQIIETLYIINNINLEFRSFEGKEINIIPKSPISYCWTINWNLILPCPIINTILIIYLLSQFPNQLTRCYYLFSVLLFIPTLFQYWL